MTGLWRRRRQGPLSCAEVGEQVQLFVDGRVEVPTAHRIEAHLEDCRRCGLEVEAYLQIKGALARAKPEGIADALSHLRHFGEHLAGSGGDPTTEPTNPVND